MFIHEAVSEALHRRAGIRRAGWPAGRKLVIADRKKLSSTWFYCFEDGHAVMHDSGHPRLFHPSAEELAAGDWMLTSE